MEKVEPAKLTLKNGKEIYIATQTDWTGDVDIVAFDKDGDKIDCGIIMTISKNGFYRISGISDDVGLPTNSEGQLKKDKEY